MSTKTLSIDDVRHIAQLANLSLTDEQIKVFTSQLTQVLDYINKIQQLDTQGVIETSQVTGLENIFREDVIETNHDDTKHTNTFI